LNQTLRIRLFRFATFFLVLLFSACRQQRVEQAAVVWSANPILITREELQESFLLRPKFPAKLKGRQALQAQLDAMIRQKYLAWSAEKMGLDQDEKIISRLRWVRHKAMREQLFKREISGSVRLTESELRRAFIQRNRFISARHLFFKTPSEASLWRQRIVNGMSFAEAAAWVYKEVDAEMAASGGKLPTFTWGDMDPGFESAAFSLREGELSQPVASSWGYHLILVDSIAINPMLTETDFFRDREKIERILRKRREDSLATIYVAKVMQGLEVRVKGDAFSFIVNQARQIRHQDDAGLPDQTPISDQEWASLSASLQERRNQVFMTYRHGQWTLTDFIQRFQAIPPLYRPHLQHPELFESELRHLIRDEFLNDRAEQLGLQTDPYVLKQVEEAKLDLLAAAMRRHLVAAISVDEAEVHRYYRTHLAQDLSTPDDELWQEIRRRALAHKQDSVITAFVRHWREATPSHTDEVQLQQALQALGGDQAAFIAVWQPPQR